MAAESDSTVRRDGEERRAALMRWGLVPHWAEDPKKGPSMINARVETVDSKPAYRRPFKRHRCLVIADGFFEWQLPAIDGAAKIPHWIHRRDDEPGSGWVGISCLADISLVIRWPRDFDSWIGRILLPLGVSSCIPRQFVKRNTQNVRVPR